MKEIKPMFKKFILLVFLFCLVDFLGGKVLKYIFDKQSSGKYFTTGYGLQHAKEDILIFGSSRANETINSPLIEQQLQLSCFNLGSQGQGILYMYPLLKTIIEKNRPKCCIISLDYKALKYDTKDYEELSIFKPFHGFNSHVDAAVSSMGDYSLLASYSALYKYNSTLGYAVLNILKPTYNKSYQSRGFDPISGSVCNKPNDYETNPARVEKQARNLHIDSNKVRYLEEIINELQRKNIKAVFVTGPFYYFPSINEDLYFIELQKLLKRKGAIFWNQARDSSFEQKCTLFNDPTHLNDKGADIFTNGLIKKIKPML